MGVLDIVPQFFQEIFASMIEALYTVSRKTIRDQLIIQDPTRLTGLGQGWQENMIVFPYLLGIAIIFGLASAPFAKRYIPMEEFAMQFIKAILFVLLIGPLFSFGVELTNILIEWMWRGGAVSSMRMDFRLGVAAMSTSITLVIFGTLLGGLTWIMLAIFLLALYLREYMVAATYVMSPIIGPVIMFSFGPFKAVSRFPLILVRMSVYLLVVGVIVAGFVMTGAAAAGAFADVEDVNTVEGIEGDSLTNVDLAYANGNVNHVQIDAVDDEILDQWAENIAENSNEFEYSGPDEESISIVRQYIADPGTSGLTTDVQAAPLVINRAMYICKAALSLSDEEGGFRSMYDEDMTGANPMLPPKGSVYEEIATTFSKSQYAKEYEGNGVPVDPSKEQIQGGCMVPLTDAGLDGILYSNDGSQQVHWVSPFDPKQMVDYADDIPVDAKELSMEEFVNNYEEELIEAEKEYLGGAEERENWRAKSAHRGVMWLEGWNDEDTSHAGFVPPALYPDTSGLTEDTWLDTTDPITDEGGFVSFGMSIDGHPGKCNVNAAEKTLQCYPNVQPVETFNQFMYLLMSLLAPILMISYTGKAAFSPMRGLASNGGSSSIFGGGKSKSSASNSGSYNPVGDSGNGTVGRTDELDVSETTVDSDHHVHAEDSAIQEEFGDPESGPELSPRASPDEEGTDWKGMAKSGAKRAGMGAKEAVRQGAHGGPVSWAVAGGKHLQQNPPGQGVSDDNSPKPASSIENENISNSAQIEQAMKEQELHGDDEAVEDIDYAYEVDELEDGDVVNTNGSWTFVEDGNDEYAQSGYLVAEDGNGDHQVMSFRTDQEDQAGLEDGATYEIGNGAVVRENDGMEQEYKNGDFNAIEPGAQTQITKVKDPEKQRTRAFNSVKEERSRAEQFEINGKTGNAADSSSEGAPNDDGRGSEINSRQDSEPDSGSSSTSGTRNNPIDTANVSDSSQESSRSSNSQGNKKNNQKLNADRAETTETQREQKDQVGFDNVPEGQPRDGQETGDIADDDASKDGSDGDPFEELFDD